MNARTRACLCIILAAALWGVIGVFFNLLSGLGFTQMQVVAIRAVTAALVLGVYILVRDPALLRVRLRDCWCFVGTGIISLVFFNWCYSPPWRPPLWRWRRCCCTPPRFS